MLMSNRLSAQVDRSAGLSGGRDCLAADLSGALFAEGYWDGVHAAMIDLSRNLVRDYPTLAVPCRRHQQARGCQWTWRIEHWTTTPPAQLTGWRRPPPPCPAATGHRPTGPLVHRPTGPLVHRSTGPPVELGRPRLRLPPRRPTASP